MSPGESSKNGLILTVSPKSSAKSSAPPKPLMSLAAQRIPANPDGTDVLTANDPELAGIFAAWTVLPAKAKTAILFIIQICADSA